jgi:hypothetical protein
LGFESSIDGDYLKATSPKHLPLFLSQTSYGIRFTLAFTVNSNALQNKAKLMDILNKLNSEALVTKFYLSQGEMVFESNYIGDYERQNFGIFMQTYLSDYDLVYKNTELAKYIGN